MKKMLTLLVTSFTILLMSWPLSAHNKVVVVPLFGGGESLANVVTVAKSNGDFTDLRSALNSIDDASAANPYLVVIAPGRYEVTSIINMKPYVSVTGSGQKATVLYGEVGGSIYALSSGILRGASHTTLSHLTIENDTPSPVPTWVQGVINSSVSDMRMNHVKVDVFGGSAVHNRAVYNYASSTPNMNDVYLKATGTNGIGLYNTNTSAPFVKNSILHGSADGVRIGSAGTRIRNTYIENGVVDNNGTTQQCRETYDYDFVDVGC